MGRTPFFLAWILTLGCLAGCNQPRADQGALVPEKPPQATMPTVAETSPPPNDILAVPSEPPPQTTTAPRPPVSRAKPLPPSQYSEKPTTAVRVHVVQPQESLYSIARRYYSDEKQWRRIFQANRNRIADPSKIEVGMKLIIP